MTSIGSVGSKVFLQGFMDELDRGNAVGMGAFLDATLESVVKLDAVIGRPLCSHAQSISQFYREW